MTDQQRADRLFQTWLESEMPTAAPPGLLDRIDIATRPVRPRPAWVARLEGHHMDVIEAGRRTGVPRLGLALVIIAALVAAVAVAAFIASQPPAVVVLPSPSLDTSPNPSLTAEASLAPSLEPTPQISVEPSLEPTPARVMSAGSLLEGRAQHAATILADGRVLITGGSGAHEPHGASYLTSTEIWDPLTNTTTASGSLDPDVDHLVRTTENAFLLPDGRVLIVPGGCCAGPNPPSPAEVWDPNSGTWRRTETLTITRTGRSATLLADGRVLIAGGVLDPFHGDGATTEAFIWDPIRETSRPTGSMIATRARHSATRLADGRVLVIGGNLVPGGMTEEPISSSEIWDPATASFGLVPSLAGVRGTAVTLRDGRVLIVDESGATLWDPRDDSVIEAGSLIHPRSDFTVTVLPDGRVLIVGDLEFSDAKAAILEVELWDPATLSFAVAGTLNNVRSGHTTTALPDGRALIVGGYFGEFGGAPLQLIEVWEPARG